jgi:hypothetical protein
MAEEPELSWPVEIIPGTDELFMRVHRTFVVNGNLIPGVFRDHGGSMSTDWNKYSTSNDTLARSKKPADNGVIGMNVGEVRAVQPLEVIHKPLTDNRAHADVSGEKSTEVRVKLLRIVTWAIPLS